VDLLPVDGAGHDLKRGAGFSATLPDRFRALVCYPGNY